MRFVALLFLFVSCNTNPNTNISEEAVAPVAADDSDSPELQKISRPWGRDTAAMTKNFFDSYDHILLVTVTQDRWESRKPPQKSLRHYNGKVAKTYKGGWSVGDEIAFETHHDSVRLPQDAPVLEGKQFFVLTKSPKTQKAISLDTGELLPFDVENEPALIYFYPR